MTDHQTNQDCETGQAPERFSDAASGGRRCRIIGDLRELADFLDANPDLPISPHTSVDLAYFPHTDRDAEAFAEVACAGAVLGVMPAWEGDHLVVEHVRGSARYRVVAIPEKVRAQYRAWLTYTGHVRPD
ncbi:hypothetical protein BJF83_23560 [Nocardiopsis sp. CNR-923]|uniref:hypothetical protein n=1 Tax=Nocardiopsis sp. CNR-923 TaxID=1904965 RepID=UPI0009653C0F|nr:hypothetical protein [Nocardiopsis sp. CNR-923]OLT24909.1 hypothetical protein BJF83_23560 [Nocardiopsis sp. CNR-923]